MKITIEINCDNAAFSEEPAQEVGRILNELAPRLENMLLIPGENRFPLSDVNGNIVGYTKICH